MSPYDIFCWAFGISCSAATVALAGLLVVGCARAAKEWIGEILE